MTARSKAYTRIGCLPDCWSDRTLRPVRRPEALNSCTKHVRGLSASLRPCDVELLAASAAAHATRPSGERLPLTAARADGVALVAARGETHRIARARDHTPFAGRTLNDLQERGRDLEEASTDLENGLQRIEPRDAIPRATAKLQVQVGPRASPHPRHRVTSVRLALIACERDAPSQVPPRGCSTVAATFRGVLTSY